MPQDRVAVYIDGFNLYHGIAELNVPHLKWVNLRTLANKLIATKSQKIMRVRYFSAYANHFSGTKHYGRLVRHREYVKALKAKNIECHMGKFATRYLKYFGGKQYKAQWRKREEKQTDVALGSYLIRDAYCNEFDIALVISVDTDMIPAFEIMRDDFPNKQAICVAPPGRSHHRDLQSVASGIVTIKRSQIEKSLFSRYVRKNGAVAANRPREYAPPR